MRGNFFAKKMVLFALVLSVCFLVSGDVWASMDIDDIIENIRDSVSDTPGLVSAISYLSGLILGVIGIMKLKAHVEDPREPLKHAAIAFICGGLLLALPMLYEAMNTTFAGQDGSTDSSIGAPQIYSATVDDD